MRHLCMPGCQRWPGLQDQPHRQRRTRDTVFGEWCLGDVLHRGIPPLRVRSRDCWRYRSASVKADQLARCLPALLPACRTAMPPTTSPAQPATPARTAVPVVCPAVGSASQCAPPTEHQGNFARQCVWRPTHIPEPTNILFPTLLPIITLPLPLGCKTSAREAHRCAVPPLRSPSLRVSPHFKPRVSFSVSSISCHLSHLHSFSPSPFTCAPSPFCALHCLVV